MKFSLKPILLAAIVAITCLPYASQAQRSLKTNEIEIRFTTSFNPVYADNGTGANLDLSTWKPVVTPGYYALGHLAKAGYAAPVAEMVMVKAIDPTALRHPVDYRKIYGDHGTGGDQDGSFWEPIPPAGYVALGMVAMRSYAKPSLTEVVCVRNDLVTPAKIGAQIWNDGGSGGDMDVSIWQIIGGSNANVLVSNSFYAHGSYSQPKSAQVCYGLKLY